MLTQYIFIEHLLCASLLGTGGRVVNKIDKTCLPLLSLECSGGGQKINKVNKTQYIVYYKVINVYK